MVEECNISITTGQLLQGYVNIKGLTVLLPPLQFEWEATLSLSANHRLMKMAAGQAPPANTSKFSAQTCR